MEPLLVEFAIRASLIVLTTALMLRVLRIRIAAAQHAVWAGVLIAMLALPLWLAWGPKATLPVLPAPSEPAVVMRAAPVSLVDPATPLEVSEAPATKPPVWSWDAVWIGVYLLGAGALLLRLAIGTIRASRLDSASCVAPVTVGLLRPRIILPDRCREWPVVQLDAVLSHERAHARRRDPLFQWLALLNRAVFWFHPLAWWLERRLSALAEEACDSAVLERGHDPREYSECLLDLARAVQLAGTRVNVVAVGMPGSYLPQRVKKIIDGIRAPRVSPIRMACTAVACAVPVALFAAGTLGRVQPNFPPTLPLPAPPQPPVVLAQAPTVTSRVSRPKPVQPAAAAALAFEVVSVRPVDSGGGRGGMLDTTPGRVVGQRVTGTMLIEQAYGLNYTQSEVIGAPGWLQTEKYDIEGKADGNPSKDQLMLMVQTALVDRFKLKVHRETKEGAAYALVVGKSGPKVHQVQEGDPLPAGRRYGLGTNVLPIGGRMPMSAFAQFLSGPMGELLIEKITPPQGRSKASRPVIDKTGLEGLYDFSLVGAPDDDFLIVLQEQLGLKLEPTKIPIDVLVIDHIEKPDEN
jgi:bla regulator protein blaR1